MSEEFYRYVRGLTDDVPPGYTEQGMRVYRHLVFVGASQIVESHYPAIRRELGEEGWHALISEFVRRSAWQSPYYADLKDEFLAFIDQVSTE